MTIEFSINKIIIRCPINIPITFIFRNGQPAKSLRTDPSTNVVVRVPIDNVTVERSLGEAGPQGGRNRSLGVMRKLLLDFNVEYGYNKFQDGQESPPICTVSRI